MDGTKDFEMYLRQLLSYGQETLQPLNESDYPKSEREFAALLNELGNDIQEMKRFASELADGNLSGVPQTANPLLDSLKSLHSNIRHITWQARQVEGGDYSQRIDFMGEFSESFNSMVEKLKVRSEEQKESERTERKIARQRESMLTMQLRQQVRYYLDIVEANQRLSKFRHDTRNHYFSLDSLLEKGDIEGAQEYLRTITSIVKPERELIQTGNIVFDALLTDKLNIARTEGIEVESSIILDRHLRINNFDWCSLFGNVLDNAIEACTNIPKDKRKIWVSVKNRGNVLQTDIRNTALPPKKIVAGYQSSKMNPEEHGWGMRIIEDVVQKYGGVLKVDYRCGIFKLSFLLCDV